MSAVITVTAHAKGWRIEAMGTGSPYPFTADLTACPLPDGHTGAKARAACSTGYHRSHVERLAGEVAKTYGRRTEVPTVPARASA